MITARGPPRVVTEAAAKNDAMNRPTGVAMTNPAFGESSSTPGVASACRPRKPALARKDNETRTKRASRCRVATTFVMYASATLPAAVSRTNQKWLG